jgi:hypothetical protein
MDALLDVSGAKTGGRSGWSALSESLKNSTSGWVGDGVKRAV